MYQRLHGCRIFFVREEILIWGYKVYGLGWIAACIPMYDRIPDFEEAFVGDVLFGASGNVYGLASYWFGKPYGKSSEV